MRRGGGCCRAFGEGRGEAKGRKRKEEKKRGRKKERRGGKRRRIGGGGWRERERKRGHSYTVKLPGH